MALLKNVEARWANLYRPEKMFRSTATQWSIKALCTEEEANNWMDQGYALKVRRMKINDVSVPYILLSKPTHRRNGDPTEPPRVVDKYGKDIDPNIVGNGSIVSISYRTFDWDFQGRKGVKTELVAVMVSDLHPFERTDPKFEFEYTATPREI